MKRCAGAGLDEIEAVYRRRLPELRQVATAITGNREPGLDAVQDAFAMAVHRRTQFRREGSLEGWLWRIVVHTAQTAAARLAASTATRADLLETRREADDETDAGLAEMRALVRELPDRQRLVLFLRYYADLDYVTIADTLEISAGTVGATLNQARQTLRRLMDETEVRPG
jgi:RNA polymerase sigma-70 factor (ECF subfamily)